MNIKMHGDETRILADNFLLNLDDFKNQIQEFLNIVDSIHSAWEGTDATKFISSMKEKNIAELERLSEILSDYGNYLKRIPTAYETLDEIFTTKGIEF